MGMQETTATTAPSPQSRRGRLLRWLRDRLAAEGSLGGLLLRRLRDGVIVLLLILLLGVQLGWLPTSGRFETASIVMPALTLGIVHGGRIYQLVRSATFEEMSKPYVTVARSKGLTEWNILRRHVVRNTGVTTATIVGWEYVRMWGGAVFAIEYVFAWPGVGLLTIDAAHRQDFFVLQAAVIIAGAFVIFSNLLIDMGYQFIDRRIAAS